MLLAGATLLLLLARGASAQGFGGGCSSGGSPCKHACANGVYDLTGFKQQMPATGFYHVTDDQQHDFYFDACGPISKVTCTGSSVQQPVAIQTWGAAQPPAFPSTNCASLGAESSQICNAANGSTFTCDYSQGDGDRTLSMKYTCAAAYQQPTASQPDPESNPPHYVIVFTGPAACGGGGGAGGTSWGTLFMILFPLSVALYFGLGFGYNYRYNELRGADAVPQLEYWKQLPGLVKDGCLFSYQQTSLFIAWAREKQRGGAPADPGLKRALADNEDGGTSYEAAEDK